MFGKRKTVLLILAMILVLVAAFFAYRFLSDRYKTEPLSKYTNDTAEFKLSRVVPNETIPTADFSMQDENGNTVWLSDYFGKPIVLNFWATWCGPCKTELPYFDELAKEYGGKVRFLMVDLTDGSRETLSDVEAFLAETGYTFPVYFDTSLNGALTYDASTIPVTFFIDSHGYLRATQRGSISQETLKKGIEALLLE